MLGSRRPPSAIDCLERPPPKLPKEDALSIYEATLQKLRLGARRVLRPVESMETDSPVCVDASQSSSSDNQIIKATDDMD